MVRQKMAFPRPKRLTLVFTEGAQVARGAGAAVEVARLLYADAIIVAAQSRAVFLSPFLSSAAREQSYWTLIVNAHHSCAATKQAEPWSLYSQGPRTHIQHKATRTQIEIQSWKGCYSGSPG